MLMNFAVNLDHKPCSMTIEVCYEERLAAGDIMIQWPLTVEWESA